MKGKAGTGTEEGTTESCLEIDNDVEEMGARVQIGKCCKLYVPQHWGIKAYVNI